MVGGTTSGRSESTERCKSSLQCGRHSTPSVDLTAFQRVTCLLILFLTDPSAVGWNGLSSTTVRATHQTSMTASRPCDAPSSLSYNASAVKLQQLVGSDQVVETARRFGISTELHPYPPSRSVFWVRLIDLVRAYSAIANLGGLPEPYFISEVFGPGRASPRALLPAHRADHVGAGQLPRVARSARGDRTRYGNLARFLEANLAGKAGHDR